MAGDNITYIIGAGASANALPVVGDNFNKRIIVFCRLMLDRITTAHAGSKNLVTFINNVIEELPKHYSVDTYARKLKFHSTPEYHAFKFLLSYYLMFEQFANHDSNSLYSNSAINLFTGTFKHDRKTTDPRYDVLYAALLDETTKSLPDNINVISWNYDVQFEKSYASFFKADVNYAFDKLKVYPSPIGRVEDVNSSKFLKLNGTAGLVFNNSPDVNIRGFKFNSFKDKNNAIEMIDCCIQDTLAALMAPNLTKETLLYFAWDNTGEILETRAKAKEIIENTSVLIIIGYSFPVYNRKIDKEIFSNIKNIPVFIQVMDQFETVRERFESIIKFSTNIKQVKETSQFYIPDNLL